MNTTTDNQLAVIPQPASNPIHGIDFFNIQQFAQAERIATMFSKSSLLPDAYKGNIGNCVIALDIAARTGSSPLMVAQNLHIIHGKPSWSASYIIAAINSCGRFTPLQYEVTDLGPLDVKGVRAKSNKQVIAYAWDRSRPSDYGKKEARLEGAPVTCEIAVLEGWWSKQGSKWPTMTDLMLRYRAAAWFGRMYAPEILMGMHTEEEAIDVETTVSDPAANAVNDRLGLPETASGGMEQSAEKITRKRKGVSAAPTTTVDVPSEPAAPKTETPPPPAETTAPKAEDKKPDPAPVQQEPPKEEKPKPTSEAMSAARAERRKEILNPKSYRTEVEEAVGVNATGGEVWTKLVLQGVPKAVFFDAPMNEAPGVGHVIDCIIGNRPNKNDPSISMQFMVSWELVAG